MITIEGKQIFTTLEELVNPEYTALLLVDIQNDYCSRGGYLDKVGLDISMARQVPTRVKPVLEAARRCGVLVVHIVMTYYPGRHESSAAWLRMVYKLRVAAAKRLGKPEESAAQWMGETMEGTWGCQEVDEVAPLPGEIIVKKHRSSAFVGTNLDMILRTNGIKSVVSVGVVTEGCVESTARDAQFYDYYSIVLGDCIATGTRELHEAALFIMSNRVDIVDSSEVIEVWSR
jgi:nicotinamidase-related amidase